MTTHSSILAQGNPMARGAGRAIVHGIVKSRTQLGDFHFHFDPLLLFPKSLKLYRSSSVSATQWSSASSDLF